MILLGYDGSEDARTAIEQAGELTSNDVIGSQSKMTGEQGAELGRARLEQRAEQVEGVLERLRGRARAPDAGAAERTGLQRAAGDFAAELAQIRQLLNNRDGNRRRSRSNRVRRRAA